MTRASSQELSYAAKEKLRQDTEESLFTAVGSNLGKIVERILLSGSVSVNARNSDGATPLHVAAVLGYDELCATLHNFGADLDSLWDGSTALHLAVSENRSEVVPVLVGLGAKVDIRDALGFTPLHLVAIRGNRSLAAYLISAGADPSLVDGDGKTVAQRWNFASQIPALHDAERQISLKNDFAHNPPEIHSTVSEPALLKVFRAFDTFREDKKAEAVTPTFYEMKYHRSITFAELHRYFQQHVDPCGLPPSAVEKKIDSLLSPIKRFLISHDGGEPRVPFERFCVVWLKAQTMGLV